MKKHTHLVDNPLNLSARFLAVRPELVSAWIAGAHGLLPIFKTKNKMVLLAFLETVQSEFFSALKHHWKHKNPEQKMTYTFGTICLNKRGDERLVIGIKPNPNGKPVYEYLASDGTINACNEASMQSWMEKR